MSRARAQSGDAGDAESWKLLVVRAVLPVMWQCEKPRRHLRIFKIQREHWGNVIFMRIQAQCLIPGHLRKGVGFLDILAGTEDLASTSGLIREASSCVVLRRPAISFRAPCPQERGSMKSRGVSQKY